jgi:cysteinyl-tRNA synthetase
MGKKSELYLYNTLSRKKELFVPIADDAVRVYSCGPTVYDTAHIGNMRSYIFMDILRRVLKRNGYRLMHVMNITDVGHLVSDEDTGEDKMIKGAREKQKTPWEIAAEYTDLFMKDTAALNIDMPEIIPRATGHIPQMLEMIGNLFDKGIAYELSDGVYYDIGKFQDYGRLSRLDLDE